MKKYFLILIILFLTSCAQKQSVRSISNTNATSSMKSNCYKKDVLSDSSGLSQAVCGENDFVLTGGCSIPKHNSDLSFIKIESSMPILSQGVVIGWECRFGEIPRSSGQIPSIKYTLSRVICCK